MNRHILNYSNFLIPLKTVNVWMISSSYQCETLPRWGKQTLALQFSSWLLLCCLWKISRGHSRLWLCCVSWCCHFTASYISSHITCFAWTGGSGTIVPPYLRGQLGGTSAHRRILIQAVNASHCWILTHMGLYLGRVCVCLIKITKTKKDKMASEHLKTMFTSLLDGKLWFHHTPMAYEWWVTLWPRETIPPVITLIKEIRMSQSRTCHNYTPLILKNLNLRWV